MSSIPRIGGIGGLKEIPGATDKTPGSSEAAGSRFAESLKSAVQEVDSVQKESAASQLDYVRGEDVDLHDVLIKIEEAEIAFKAMMEVRGKLVDAYREVMRLGGGG